MFEKMLADMLGITPEQMAEMIGGMQTLLRDGVSTLNKIEKDVAAIKQHLNVPEAEAENGPGNDAS